MGMCLLQPQTQCTSLGCRKVIKSGVRQRYFFVDLYQVKRFWRLMIVKLFIHCSDALVLLKIFTSVTKSRHVVDVPLSPVVPSTAKVVLFVEERW